MHPRISFTVALLLSSSVAFAAEDRPADPRVVEDCRVEGAANGMTGPSLEQFIRDCVKEFEEAHLSGTTRAPEVRK
ncbi:MAG: hypothetical protein ACFCUG_14940 [Thiotrichales bacterium]